jgi:dihydroorotase
MTKVFFDRFHVIDPASGRDEISSMVVEGGVIAAIGAPQEIGPAPKSTKAIKGDGAFLVPGLIDMRVQSRYPGYAHKENRASLARAAAAGGITSMICLPNTDPVLDDPDSLTALIRPAPKDDVPAPNIFAYGAATVNLEDEAMAELGLLAEAGAVGFTNGVLPVSDSLIMRRIMDYAAMLDKPVIQHAEDLSLAAGGEMHEGENSTRLGLRGIPAEAEEIMIARDLSLVRLTGARYHVAHISTSRSIDLIRAAKTEGLAVSCDTAPPYYMLNDVAAMEYDTKFRLSPPLRGEEDRQAVLAGIADGTIDVIASDHAPQDRDSKLLPFGVAETGSSALETLLPMLLNLHHHGHVSISRAIEMATASPAKLLDIPGGTLAQGAGADFVIIDPDRGWQIRGAEFNSLSNSTPFEGQPVQGKVLSTWIGGSMIYQCEKT